MVIIYLYRLPVYTSESDVQCGYMYHVYMHALEDFGAELNHIDSAVGL